MVWFTVYVATLFDVVRDFLAFVFEHLPMGGRVLFWPAIVVLSMATLVRLISLWNDWNLVRFDDCARLLSIDPLLRATNRYKSKRFDQTRLFEVINAFHLPDGSLYYNYEGSRFASLQAGEKPVVVLKLPARNHLSLVDFQDLRLLRKLVIEGGQVLVVIVDVPYAKSDLGRDMGPAASRTGAFVRRILGSSARIFRLSSVISQNVRSFEQYLLDVYIPFYARNESKNTQSLDPEGTGRVSYMAFGLTLWALKCLVSPNQPVMVIQWGARKTKWREFSDYIVKWLPELRIVGFVVGQHFPDHTGKKLLTSVDDSSTVLFSMTSPTISIAQQLLSHDSTQDNIAQWKVSDEYVTFLSRNILGQSIHTSQAPQTRRHKKSLHSFLAICPELESKDIETMPSLYSRYQFFRELSRIQRELHRAIVFKDG